VCVVARTEDFCVQKKKEFVAMSKNRKVVDDTSSTVKWDWSKIPVGVLGPFVTDRSWAKLKRAGVSGDQIARLRGPYVNVDGSGWRVVPSKTNQVRVLRVLNSDPRDAVDWQQHAAALSYVREIHVAFMRTGAARGMLAAWYPSVVAAIARPVRWIAEPFFDRTPNLEAFVVEADELHQQTWQLDKTVFEALATKWPRLHTFMVPAMALTHPPLQAAGAIAWPNNLSIVVLSIVDCNSMSIRCLDRLWKGLREAKQLTHIDITTHCAPHYESQDWLIQQHGSVFPFVLMHGREVTKQWPNMRDLVLRFVSSDGTHLKKCDAARDTCVWSAATQQWSLDLRHQDTHTHRQFQRLVHTGSVVDALRFALLEGGVSRGGSGGGLDEELFPMDLAPGDTADLIVLPGGSRPRGDVWELKRLIDDAEFPFACSRLWLRGPCRLLAHIRSRRDDIEPQPSTEWAVPVDASLGDDSDDDRVFSVPDTCAEMKHIALSMPEGMVRLMYLDADGKPQALEEHHGATPAVARPAESAVWERVFGTVTVQDDARLRVNLGDAVWLRPVSRPWLSDIRSVRVASDAELRVHDADVRALARE
jgi:hypothetical protein